VARAGARHRGGAAALRDIASGDVLALASAPRYDLTKLARELATLSTDQRRPLFHRATAAFPPGSTFKIVSSIAYFGPGRLDLDWSTTCEGAYDPKHRAVGKCEATGHLDLLDALARSCNVFF